MEPQCCSLTTRACATPSIKLPLVFDSLIITACLVYLSVSFVYHQPVCLFVCLVYRAISVNGFGEFEDDHYFFLYLGRYYNIPHELVTVADLGGDQKVQANPPLNPVIY